MGHSAHQSAGGSAGKSHKPPRQRQACLVEYEPAHLSEGVLGGDG